MVVRLRAHHLLCLLTFVGRGYSAAFVSNMEEIAARLAGETDDVMLVDGPDDICNPLLGTADQHCLEPSVGSRDEKAAEDISVYLGFPVRAGVVLPARRLRDLRAAFRAGTIRMACRGCPWADLCTAVADTEFADARLRPSHSAVEHQQRRNDLHTLSIVHGRMTS